jgi:aminoglycoside phosphotransferase (APT) family kinase protein
MATASSEPRVHPRIDLDLASVRAMLAPVNLGGEPINAAPVEGGIINTLYRVTIGQPGATYALRVCPGATPRFERDIQFLRGVRAALPVPLVLLADGTGSRYPYPYVVYPWIEGITLNEFRRQRSRDALTTLAAPLGELLARIVATDPSVRDGRIGIAERLERADLHLREGLARARLGDALADGLRLRFTVERSRLLELDRRRGLVHGDFGGRNVLVRQTDSGSWEVSGVLDWDCAATGSPLWDVGSLFRYHRRYSPAFRERFAAAYRASGGTLPDDWWYTARLLDATRLVDILDEDHELPSVFAECHELIEQLTFDDPDASAL